MPNVSLRAVDFLSLDQPVETFDLITFVASLHHMETAAALVKARELLRSGGELIVVGLSVNRTATDWIISAGLLPLIKSVGLVRRHGGNPGVIIADPTEHLSEIRTAAAAVIPGATIRRGLYYRYVLQWSKPPQL
jgi:SAM-dependent methyltransferase